MKECTNSGAGVGNDALREEILRLKKEKNAVILAHYYVDGALQDIADYVGDSLALAQKAADAARDADVVVMCGVNFMGETVKVLCPDKTVLMPDLEAGCSLADSCPAEEFAAFVAAHPDAPVLAHPECRRPVLLLADKVGSTAALLEYALASPAKEFIVATESGILHQMRKGAPEKTFIAAPPTDSTCGCNECAYMKLNTLAKLRDCLRDGKPEIQVDPELAERALRPIERMLSLC